ncbi:unnamed protein product [Bursaphelenchus okinawaensis]|uniref:SHSP domain-containing protein n=1 Tax=Bursaphelenchus okinawaensis TaxID=465554 RepID=A0A811K2X2_9BILA|nr:unnamed protein product [Bursaphelenchus okinawaensis]CAG9090562.1 unnamed protein product [Bursaphelenchus okinawaensis]
MSLLLFDPFRSNAGYHLSPFQGLLGELQRMERELGQWDYTDGFAYTCNVQGFRPEEIEVHHEGDSVTISAHHKQSGRHEHYEKSLKRTIRIPEGFNKDHVQCDINEKGELIVKVPKLAEANKPEKRSIPINFKQSKPVENK